MEIKKPPVALLENQYYKQTQMKDYIFLHHTAGLNVKSIIEWWNSKPDHIATPYLIDRDGSIYELFDPHYWSYALGVKGGTSMEKASIHIELVSLGQLYKLGTEYRGIGKKLVDPSEVYTLPSDFRGSRYYHRYTDEQIASLEWLLKKLMKDFGIKKQPENLLAGFWDYREPFKEAFTEGIWSHTSVRKDKSDIHPQTNLINMVYNLVPGA